MGHIREKDIEEAIENSLIKSGFVQSVSHDFDRKSCLNTKELFEFLEATQSELLNEFKKFRSTNWQEKIVEMIETNIAQKGLIAVLREGVEDYSLSSNLRLVYFKPNNTKNEATVNLYNANIFSLTRQLYFEEGAKTSIDLVLFLNGFPLVVMELKNKYTGQNTKDAEKQFRLDRSYKSKLSIFNNRTLIYFAVDNDEVTMTTELKGKDTFFLPFNQGNQHGAGNPMVDGKFKTYYLWEKVLLQDSLLDIFRNFYFLKIDEKNPKKKTAIFPRYHQLDVVTKVEQAVKEEKTGHKYLIQHSAGSGKTNSISWLTHRLSKLHDEEENLIFDGVIVITDRKVLDTQLQNAIYQLDKTKGIVVKIDEKKNSNDLALALQKKSKIIITTIQKFAYAYKKIKNLQKHNYAIVIDEAHSSTSGDNINYLKLTLSGKSFDQAKAFDSKFERSSEDDVNQMIEAITDDTKHLSFFAFTATPKDKTMQIFGRVGDDNLAHEFHLYSMRQAIEERFILDPLKNYMIIDTYFKIGKKIADNPIFEKRGANKAIGAYINLNEYNIKQKVAIIVEDFMSNRALWLNNEAKAMIVTSSRLHALKYKLALNAYLAKHYPMVKSLIAFSGELEVDGIKYQETTINDITEKELVETFDTNKDIKFLVVADKYQTGFDQPKLCAMYVDKMLSGVTAVQTLSRLNRVTKGKENTFVLDFVNSVKTIKESFSRYYTDSNIEEMTDPNIIFEFYHHLDEFHICYEEEAKAYVQLYLKEKRNIKENITMDNLVSVAIERFTSMDDETKKNGFKTYVIKFVRAYNFLIQIYPIKKTSLYEMYIYLGALIKKFPKEMISKVELNNLLSLDFYKLKRMNGDEVNGEDLSLASTIAEPLQGYQSGGSRRAEKEEVDLNSLIQRVNDLFGLDLSDEDRLAFFDQPLEAHKKNEDLKDIATVNSYDEFEEQFKKSYFLKMMLNKKSTNEELFQKIFTDNAFKSYLVENMSKELYQHFNPTKN